MAGCRRLGLSSRVGRCSDDPTQFCIVRPLSRLAHSFALSAQASVLFIQCYQEMLRSLPELPSLACRSVGRCWSFERIRKRYL